MSDEDYTRLRELLGQYEAMPHDAPGECEACDELRALLAKHARRLLDAYAACTGVDMGT